MEGFPWGPHFCWDGEQKLLLHLSPHSTPVTNISPLVQLTLMRFNLRGRAMQNSCPFSDRTSPLWAFYFNNFFCKQHILMMFSHSPNVSQTLPPPYPSNFCTCSSHRLESVVPCHSKPFESPFKTSCLQEPFPDQTHSTLIVGLNTSISPTYINILVGSTILSKI